MNRLDARNGPACTQPKPQYQQQQKENDENRFVCDLFDSKQFMFRRECWLWLADWRLGFRLSIRLQFSIECGVRFSLVLFVSLVLRQRKERNENK